MPTKEQAFATRVIQGFREASLHTDAEIVAAGGPSTSFMTNLRKVANGEAEMAAPRGDTLKRIDRAAEWKPGSARALWVSGVEPVVSTYLGPPRIETLDNGDTIHSGVQRPVVRRIVSGGLEGYVEHLAGRLLEVEERLDLLELRERRSGPLDDDLDNLPDERDDPAPIGGRSNLKAARKDDPR